MHLSTFTSALIFGASLASAHYSVTFPWWRGDSFETQWTYPCGGVGQNVSASNRTDWPLDGGAIVFQPHHPWSQTMVNLGLGNEVTSFRTTLVTPFNQTGNGTFCFKHIAIPESIKKNITEGTLASLQMVMLSTSGGALYNCMDIRFTSKAKNPADSVCFNSTGVGAQNLEYPPVVPTSSNTSEPGKPSGETCKSSAERVTSSLGMLVAVVACAGVALSMA